MPKASPNIRLETVSTLKNIPANDWDRLAHGPRAWKNEPEINAIDAKAESAPERLSQAESGVRHQDHHAPKSPADSSREAPDSVDEGPESSREAADSPHEEDEANPFISHAFLQSLEDSGSVGGQTGWMPLHILARAESGTLIGAMPVYAKTHSRGEYVFDHAFADAYARAGGRYYPKLQISVPFTPVTARKFLIAPNVNEAETRVALLGALSVLRLKLGASSIHATFLTEADRQRFSRAGYLLRTDQQFHFTNPGYADFDAFLAELASRKRKTLVRERRDALANGITIERLTGAEITEAHWDAFFTFYMETGSRKWGTPYLTRAFFSLIGERMADKLLLVIARRAGRIIAGALNFIGANTLYGRNWGAIEHHPFLHFELCYYQAIDFAIERGLARVEAGAQGDHKLARGYRPVKTHSAHYFADPGFQRAVANYLDHERAEVDLVQASLETLTPFRRGDQTG